MSMDFYVARMNAEKGWMEMVPELEHLSVNLSNGNACSLLRALNVEVDYCGTLDLDAVGAEAMILAYGEADAALPTTESGGPGTGQVRMIECGRREGYLQERAKNILALITAAKAGGFSVCWA